MSQSIANEQVPFVEYLDNPKLKRFCKRLAPGEYLFRQGEKGNTMFIVADGTVWLVAEREGEEHVAAVLERGQFIGEKAVMQETLHTRFFSARAKTHALVLELQLKDMDMIHQTMPEVLVDMLRRMFHVAADRLNRSNYLVRALRSSDNVERLCQIIAYYAQVSGRKTAEGVEFLLSPDSIHYYIDMDKAQIQMGIEELCKRKHLKKVLNDYYILKDEQMMLGAVPNLREHLKKQAPPTDGAGGTGISSRLKLFTFGKKGGA